jgi:hypothetical protein
MDHASQEISVREAKEHGGSNRERHSGKKSVVQVSVYSGASKRGHVGDGTIESGVRPQGAHQENIKSFSVHDVSDSARFIQIRPFHLECRNDDAPPRRAVDPAAAEDL